MVFQTQVPISLVILAIGIQDVYISKYKYTIMTGNLQYFLAITYIATIGKLPACYQRGVDDHRVGQ